MKKIIFACGLPRSGSTLFLNLLMQNPKIYSTATSALPDIITPIKNGFRQIESVKAMEEDKADDLLINTLNGIIDNAYETDREITVIKSRSWLNLVETLIAIREENPKFLVFVRNIGEICASFELLYRKTRALGITSQELAFASEMQTVDSRANVFLKSDQVIGNSINLLKDALQCGYGQFMHGVRFGYFTQYPKETMKRFYDWIEEDYFEHDFENIEQVIFENDMSAYSFRDLHSIRNKIEPVQLKAQNIYGKETAKKLTEASEFMDMIP